ncbi:MAG TPA: hypothetical protein VKY74_22980 [Chloroflexia bacterium]|nr:hypothetical protein [Chloroflexia bacterium]
MQAREDRDSIGDRRRRRALRLLLALGCALVSFGCMTLPAGATGGPSPQPNPATRPPDSPAAAAVAPIGSPLILWVVGSGGLALLVVSSGLILLRVRRGRRAAAPAPAPAAALTPFQHAQMEQARLRGAVAAGQITPQQYTAAIAAMRIQDPDGRYWLLGVDGCWYMHDGHAWRRADPP